MLPVPAKQPKQAKLLKEGMPIEMTSIATNKFKCDEKEAEHLLMMWYSRLLLMSMQYPVNKKQNKLLTELMKTMEYGNKKKEIKRIQTVPLMKIEEK